MRNLLIRLAVLLTAVAGIGTAAAVPAMACTSGNCTNGTVNVGSTIGTTGFPTSFVINANAGATGTATASPYSVFSNVPWHLNFGPDASDQIPANVGPAVWSIPTNPTVNFQISGTTTIGHNGGSFTILSGGAPLPPPVQIDSGGPTAGGQNYADQFSVAVPAAAAPGAYQAVFNYILAAS